MLQALPGAELRVLAGGLTPLWKTVLDPVPVPEPAVLQEMQRWVVVPPVSHQAFPGTPGTVGPSRNGSQPFPLGSLKQRLQEAKGPSQGWEEPQLPNGIMGSSPHHCQDVPQAFSSQPRCPCSQLLPPRAPSHRAQGSGECGSPGTGGSGPAHGTGAASPQLSPPGQAPWCPRLWRSLWGRHRQQGPTKQGPRSSTVGWGPAEGPGWVSPWGRWCPLASLLALNPREGGNGLRRSWMTSWRHQTSP